MTVASKPKEFWAYKLLQTYKENLETFPSESDRKEILEALNGVKAYFLRVEESIRRLPNEEERRKIVDAIDVLLKNMDRASDLSAYASVFQIPAGKLTLRRKPVLVSQAQVEAKLQELNLLPTDRILSKLLDDAYLSKTNLILLAQRLKVVTSSHMSRQEIADRVFKRGFANPRGYEMLKTGVE